MGEEEQEDMAMRRFMKAVGESKVIEAVSSSIRHQGRCPCDLR